MEIKDWLAQGKTINKEICALKTALDKAMHLPGKSESCELYKDLLEDKITQLSKTNSDIISAIYSIEDNILRTLLIERFINNNTWEIVSYKLGYDFYHVIKRLYPKAIAEIENKKRIFN